MTRFKRYINRALIWLAFELNLSRDAPGDEVLFLRFSLLFELNLACIAAIFRLLAPKFINAVNPSV